MDTTIKDTPPLSAGWTRLVELLHQVTGTKQSAEWRLGAVQSSGAMTVVPIFGPEWSGFTPPSAGARLHRVHTYGDVELVFPDAAKTGADDLAIVPLHMGFIQHGAQNHALCASALIAPGKSVRFTDARCVQAAQGGLLEGKEQWFFVLPLALRGTALGQAGARGYNLLWPAIAALNREFDLPARGHLEQLLTRQRAYLTQFRSRFECQERQTGAIFFVGGRLAGVEIAPNAAYFADIWMPLVSFAYGVAAYAQERRRPDLYGAEEPFADITTLADLRRRMGESRAERDALLGASLGAAAPTRATAKPVAVVRQSGATTALQTVTSPGLAGQIVRRNDAIVYASLFAAK